MLTKQELKTIMRNIRDCEDYLEGRAHSAWVKDIAEHAAKQAIIERSNNLYMRLAANGLAIQIDEEA